MKLYDNFLEILTLNPEVDLGTAFVNVRTAIETGQILDDPKMLLSLILFAVAGLILVAVILVFLFRQSKGTSWEEPDLFTLESRIQALEMALADQRNLVLTIKTQNRADMGYFKQEMKDLYVAIQDLDQTQVTDFRRRKVSNSGRF